MKKLEIAAQVMAAAQAGASNGELMATDVMSRVMNIFWQAALTCREKNLIDQSFTYAKDAAIVAADLAKFQAPQLQSVTVARVDPYAGLNDAELFEELKRRAALVGLVPKGPPPKLIQGKIVKGDDDDC